MLFLFLPLKSIEGFDEQTKLDAMDLYTNA